MVQLLKNRKRSTKAPETPPVPPQPAEERTETGPGPSGARENAYQPIASRRPSKSIARDRDGLSRPPEDHSKANKSKEKVPITSADDSSTDDETMGDEVSKRKASAKNKKSVSVSKGPNKTAETHPSAAEEMDVDEVEDDNGNGNEGQVDNVKLRNSKKSVPKSVVKSKAKTSKAPIDDSENSSSEKEDIPCRVSKPTSASPNAPARSDKSSTLPRSEEMDTNDGNDTSQSLLSSPVQRRRRTSGFRIGRAAETIPTGTGTSSVYGSESGISEYNVDPNDPDWLKFIKSANESLASAHERLSSDLLESSNSAALLAKLIYRSISSDENSIESKKLSEKHCAIIVRAILHLSVQNDNNSGAVIDLVNMLFTELRHFPTTVLYKTAEHCLEYMKRDQDRDGSLPPRWIEIFGKIVSVMISRGDIKHETDVMDGKGYREYIITEMCGPRMKWTTENTASLLAIIREIPGVDDNELKLLIVRIKSCLKKMKAGALPPVVHQLILLAGNRCPSEVLAVCAEYFENIDFSNLESVEVRQKRNALGTVVFHFLEAARHCDILVRAVTKIVKASFFDFGKVMSPFVLSVVLGLTTYDHAKAGIIDPLRNSIMKSFHSLHLSETSYWYRNKVGDSQDIVTLCFKSVLETKSSELEFMFDGLRELGIGLLNADLYQHKYPNTLERCQKLGSYLITALVKNCPDQLPSMMKHLMQVTSRSIVHTECLAKCLEMRTRQIIHPSIIGRTCEIIRHLPMMESTSAAMIVKALSNALNLSYILLDQLMINLRKTIWKSVEARRTAAKIMIILLSNSRVVGDVPFSQYSESQRFNDSQNQQQQSANNGQLPDNQPLCMEILTLTKRCFSQQCEIRQELYLGFHSVVRKNPGLCELVCSHLLNHTTQYLPENQEDASDASSILFSKVVDLPSEGSHIASPAVIKEELGFLIQCLSFVVHKSHQAFESIDDGPPAAVNQLEGLLEQWTKSILKTTPNTIDIAAAAVIGDAGGGSRSLDAVRYVETIFTIQTMQVTEALIEYLNLENKPGCEKVVKKLFDHFIKLEELLTKEKEKVNNKKGKGEKDKGKGKKAPKGGKDKDTTAADATTDDASETSENQAPGVIKFKKPDAPKRLFFYHILTLDSVLDMLRKLQRPADTDKGAIQKVQCNEFERFLLAVVKQKLTSFKRKESLHERSRPVGKIVEIFADIAGCIWNGLLMHNSEGEDEGGANIESIEMMDSRLELVNEIVTLLCSSHLSACDHLIKEFSDDDSENSYDLVFSKFFVSWKIVYGRIPSNEEAERSLHQHLFDVLLAFAKPLSPDTHETNRTGEVLNWIWKYMSSTSRNKGKAEFLLADSVVSCWLTYYMKGKDFLEQPGKRQHDILTLAMGVRQLLGVSDDVDTQHAGGESGVELWIINEDTAPTVLCAIMNQVEMILDHITAVLAKVKSNQNDDFETQNKIGLLRGGCFTKIDEIVTVCSQLVISRFPAGLCCTTMLKVIPQIFTVMTGFGEYFSDLIKTKRPYSLKGFAKPVAKIGKHFKPLVEGMIGHVELTQREHANEVYKKAAANKKYKGVAKVPQAVKNQLLQEKKLIPNFVYVIEKYDQLIIALSKKCDKDKLLVGMKLSTARDFKIDTKKLADAMNNQARSVQDITTVPDEESNLEIVNKSAAGSSKSRAAPRERKAKKRKNTDREDEASNDE